MKKKKSNKTNINLVCAFGSVLILVAIVGGFFTKFFAFWKFEGNVPTIIEGSIFIQPFNSITTHLTGLQEYSYSETLALLIYLLFLIVSVLGIVSSILNNRLLALIGSTIGMITVPLSIYLIMQIIDKNNFIFQGNELSALFTYNKTLETGTYSIGLWMGFYFCAAGTYIMALGVPKSKRRAKK
ncbi:hypothetical protein NEF87_004830 [Candidatus Lokiarchaeum ossiferum]|uniref:Uncharacterized protein n=1 Tax=Candidatus Lokiarchaeum ossiferum TaxID=2951803 RepID=A0ABY6HYQ8_9ARCH|nr:hypothetical protein NEF87_004830 [Candidatus Lokiarchaeum sp. B-35]